MNTFLQDIRFGARMLCKSPGFTLIAVAVLTVAIGGTTAMFSVLNAILFRPIVAKDPEQIVRVYAKENKPDGNYRTFSYPNYEDMRQRNTVLTDLSAFTLMMCGIGDGEMTRRSFVAVVSTNYFRTFGVSLKAGRTFLPEEERPGSAIPVVIASHSYWRRTGSDPDLVGKTIRVNSRNYQVVGIAPENFTGTAAVFSPELWLPLGVYELVVNDYANESHKQLSDRGHTALMLLGRLKPGMTIQQGEQQLKALAQQMAEAYPDSNKDLTFELGGLSRFSINTARQDDAPQMPAALLLVAISAVVLLIACINLANMLLARGTARRKEIAVRLALGSGRGRLIRQLLTEGLLLAALGGSGGLVIGCWGSNVLAQSLAPRIPFMMVVFDMSPDWRILAATFVACLASVLFFALGPAWRLTRPDVVSDLKEQAGQQLGSRPGVGLFAPRNMLVAAQLALSLALLTTAGLFSRGVFNAVHTNPGFSLDKGILVETDASLAGHDEARSKQTYASIVERLRALPNVEAASIAYVVPFGLFSDGRDVLKGSAPAEDNKDSKEPRVGSGYNIVADDYFKTMGLQLVKGREFTHAEATAKPGSRVAIIDEPVASQLWPGEDPIGKQIRFSGNSDTMEVVGLVAGVRNSITDLEPKPHAYVPMGQEFRSIANIHVRVKQAGTETTMLKSVRDTIRNVDAQIPIISIQTLESFHNDGLLVWLMKTAAKLFGIFGLLALFMATIGVYGVKAFVVARRTREIGIRMALGATARNVLWMIMREGMKLTALGLGVGLVFALGINFLVQSMVYGMKAIDPVVIGMAVLSLAATALVACYLPARRATRVEPNAALRYE